jgi:hypothetical protein
MQHLNEIEWKDVLLTPTLTEEDIAIINTRLEREIAANSPELHRHVDEIKKYLAAAKELDEKMKRFQDLKKLHQLVMEKKNIYIIDSKNVA